MENPVVGAPEHKLYAGAQYTHKRWTVSTGVQYIDNLYTTVGEQPLRPRSSSCGTSTPRSA